MEWTKAMQIGGLQRTSLLDFPDKISAIIFTQGCNFRCGYCHNPELIVLKNSDNYTTEGVLEFLNTRRGKLDGIVITGGEPCLQKDLIDFIKKVKAEGFLVKLDSNGTMPDVLELAIPFVDYIAMDIKAPLEKYSDIVKVKIDTEKIKRSVSLIMNSGVDYEFRTTVVKSQLSFSDFEKIGQLIQGAKRYYLQKFVPSKTLDEKMMSETTYSTEDFEKIKEILTKYVESVELR